MSKPSIIVYMHHPKVGDVKLTEDNAVAVDLAEGDIDVTVFFAERTFAAEFALDLLRKVGTLPSRYKCPDSHLITQDSDPACANCGQDLRAVLWERT